MKEIFIKLKTPLLMLLVCIVSVSGTVIYMKSTEDTKKSEEVGHVNNVQNQNVGMNEHIVSQNDSTLEGNKGYWTLSKGTKDRCPNRLDFIDDRTLTVYVKGTGEADTILTGILKKTDVENKYIFNNSKEDFDIEFKKLDPDLLSIDDCEFSRE
ncbi:hypothetical protein [Hazenella coriacea]|uniref:Uncharacterized protein n=1 Tax=Hazenella coriacea TaxID=1179467 RepID=A0A4R3L5E4_9BACL|nr:hypothetical protein [Hazenella coriacea]TCS94859.1 hypothetical protein EDD58_103282 [Hazenella coriacea]